MPWEGIDIGDDKGLPCLPARTTYPSSSSNACAGYISLEGT